MAYYAHRMRKVLTGRAGDWLARHAWPHRTMISVLALSSTASYGCACQLERWSTFAIRFSVNFLAGYAVFVAGLMLWLATKPSLDRATLLDGAPDEIKTRDPWDDEANETRQQLLEQTTQSLNERGGQGWVGLAILTMLLGTLFVAAHMVWYARWHLGGLLVLSGKVRHRALDTGATAAGLTAPLQSTQWVAVILLVHYALLGLLMQWTFPQAVTVTDVLHSLRR